MLSGHRKCHADQPSKLNPISIKFNTPPRSFIFQLEEPHKSLAKQCYIIERRVEQLELIPNSAF
jgi:hypothetical protein